MFKICTSYIWAIFCLQLVGLSHQQICKDYIQQVVSSTSYYVYSPKYPSYEVAPSCSTYTIIAPPGHEFVAQCSIEIPQSTFCTNAYFYFSSIGDLTLNNTERICGYGERTFSSTFRRVVIGYQFNGVGQGGRFLCTIAANPVCDCGRSESSRIIGVKETEIGQFPSVVGVVDSISNKIHCTGTIISDSLVITAAQCVKYGSPENIAVVVALINPDKTSPYTRLYRIASILKAPDNTANDTALLRTASKIEWSREVGPACLPFGQENNTFQDIDVYILGWNQRTNILQNALAKVISNSVCKMKYPFLLETQMCTSAPEQDACQFKHGGPLLTVGRRQYLVGIISSGDNCGGSVRVNTRITPFLNWIKTIDGNRLCYKEYN